MSDWRQIDLIWYVVVLVALVSTLSLRRTTIGFLLRAALGWAAIVLVVVVAIAHRHELRSLLSSVTERLGLDDQQVSGHTVRIRMSPDGHFWARVKLNGIDQRMLIDSGATFTAISAETAAAAEVAADGMPVEIETANGTVVARRGSLQHVAIGPLKTEDLGVVISASFGETNVLGMNFLSRLKSWRVEQNVLVLEPGSSAGDVTGDETTAAPTTERGDKS